MIRFLFAFAILPLTLSRGEVLFSRDVLPILSDHCFQCHGPDATEGRKGDLRLDDESDVKRDRDGGAVVIPHEAKTSLLVQRIFSRDPEERMPPDKLGRPLTDSQKDILRRWINEGATWGKHWAFETIQRPIIPPNESQHQIDRLVGKLLLENGLSPISRAPKETLIRRLTLDLTGLPPTPMQVSNFVSDKEAGAWSRLVDRVLESPAYGERMAWDWLEAARYADSNGYQGDRERTMWPWRDWVVKAFNENLPFDQFTIWQLAGDLLPEATHEQILATGFSRNHMINGEGGRIAEENRVDYVMDMAETMGTVWLGLTLNCCRCHDHKFDPLRQEEYYQFNAFFNQTPVNGGGGDPQTAPTLDAPTQTQKSEIAQAESTWKNVKETLTEQPTPNLENIPLALSKPPDSRNNEDWDALKAHFKDLAPEYAALLENAKRTKEELRKMKARVPKVMVMKDRKERRATFILSRGLYNQPGREVVAGVPEALPPLDLDREPNRLDLAQWLVSREHPLTARVTVNRFWQMLFGIGLVKTAEDFGVQAEYPVHRELLDWLAAEFIESGWDVKHLLRTIVTSETYQRSSTMTATAHEADPDNRLLARGPRFRMPSWMIRDQALAVSGLLRPILGGQPVHPYQPEGLWAEATFGNKRYKEDQGDALHRRSLYTFWRRIVGPSMFFDTAKRQVCEVKPLRTNTPMHALNTLNDVTYVEAARGLATSIMLETTDPAARLRLAAQRVLGRDLKPNETVIWKRSLSRTQKAFQEDSEAAQQFLAHGDAAPNTSLDQSTLAAWTAICLNLLNLDEALTKE